MGNPNKWTQGSVENEKNSPPLGELEGALGNFPLATAPGARGTTVAML